MSNEDSKSNNQNMTETAPPGWIEKFEKKYVSKSTTSSRANDCVDDSLEQSESQKNISNQSISEDSIPKAVEALRYAHDIRKFEIDLYWKRSVYFQTVLGIILGALALTLKTSDISNTKSVWVINLSILQATISYLGTVLAFAWYAATRGGKYWQRNWETHVDVLEDLVTGPLYKTVYSDKDMKWLSLLKEYPYSTSKLNSFVALIFLMLFGLVQIIFYFSIADQCLGNLRLPFLVSLILSIFTILLMHSYSKFEISNDASPHHIKAKHNTRKFHSESK